eukprot:TRINITY_DN7705_c0_g2_i1.p1 TRINITY_DN7705_c0_g2~~TRINITY_DN7705_c0_g2_i1.p1  ORF type:complete len:120 (+),score=17.40 TRINITY_DN7705_c0_g2_i1:72-431(+)
MKNDVEAMIEAKELQLVHEQQQLALNEDYVRNGYAQLPPRPTQGDAAFTSWWAQHGDTWKSSLFNLCVMLTASVALANSWTVEELPVLRILSDKLLNVANQRPPTTTEMIRCWLGNVHR